MTTKTYQPTDLTMCPSWCTLTPGHPWDSTWPDGRVSRGHGDVRFGRYLCGDAIEFEDAPGVREYSVTLHGDVDLSEPSELLALAGSAMDAALWLMEQTPFVKRDRA